MDFISFVRTQALQNDPGINAFVAIARADENFPASSDPIKLAQYLYLKLNPQATLGFQKMFMIYAQFEPSNQIPPQYKKDQGKMLEAINLIIDLQNKDSNYPFSKHF